ncbi:restriction endonuclease [Luteimicrobium album]|uniref:Restriction endonuclease n=2 Tax=Luteimicrobium album TaxID=1054550 RepID=A0ABQ6I5X8_9MICO|nr:restriction endonuclease [Luteimicrobium album]
MHEGRGRCPKCTAEADKARRPNGNPYSTSGHRRFREAVLARDPICVLCMSARATVADHYPTERRDLVDMGLDPDDPARGRGLCKPCHDKKTARTMPGGFAKA